MEFGDNRLMLIDCNRGTARIFHCRLCESGARDFGESFLSCSACIHIGSKLKTLLGVFLGSS
jgi:hypothetical protein